MTVFVGIMLVMLLSLLSAAVAIALTRTMRRRAQRLGEAEQTARKHEAASLVKLVVGLVVLICLPGPLALGFARSVPRPSAPDKKEE